VKWSTNDTITYLTNMVLGKYLVWVTDAAKCRENALIDLTLDFPPFRIPNAFTPNGDGINEKWEIAALKDFPECQVKVFNRSGHLIWWSDTGYTEPWDGIDKSGNVLPVGSYYYLVWLQSDLKPLKGTVSILR
jgi:gliding motility-associated-like protein